MNLSSLSLGLPPPVWDPIQDLKYGPRTLRITRGTHTLEPGYYPGGFRITGGDVTLKPGIYILGGGPNGKGGLVVGGDANFCAMGVMFRITENGRVDLGGTGSILVTPIGAEGEPVDFCEAGFTYPGDIDYVHESVSIFQDRENHNRARIVGTSQTDLDRPLHLPSNHVSLTGTDCGFGNAFDRGFGGHFRDGTHDHKL